MRETEKRGAMCYPHGRQSINNISHFKIFVHSKLGKKRKWRRRRRRRREKNDGEMCNTLRQSAGNWQQPIAAPSAGCVADDSSQCPWDTVGISLGFHWDYLVSIWDV